MRVGSAVLQLMISCAVLIGLCILSLIEPFWKSAEASVIGWIVLTLALTFCLGSCANLAAAIVRTHSRHDR